MTLNQVNGFYVTDLVYYILKKYPNIRYSNKYSVAKDEIIDNSMSMDKEEQLKFLATIISKAIELDRYGKKYFNETMRYDAALHCMAACDLI